MTCWLLSADYQERDVRNLEKLRGLPEKELVKIGIPYMDEMAEKLRSKSCGAASRAHGFAGSVMGKKFDFR